MDGKKLRELASDCVHCGFCLPACPTYALWGEEMDSPRGRIHLVTQVLDGAELSPTAAEHFDRCLGCMACMTACPSGVQYDRLIGAARSWTDDPAHAPAVAVPAAAAQAGVAGEARVAGEAGEPERPAWRARAARVLAARGFRRSLGRTGRKRVRGAVLALPTALPAVPARVLHAAGCRSAGFRSAGGGTGRWLTAPRARRSSPCSPIPGGSARSRGRSGCCSAPDWTGWWPAAGCRAASRRSSAPR